MRKPFFDNGFTAKRTDGVLFSRARPATVQRRQTNVNGSNGERKIEGQARLLSKRLAAGETGLELVPPFDLLRLAELPAEEDDAAVAVAREIDQPPMVIF